MKPARAPRERRRHRRVKVNIAASVYLDGQPFPCRILNISEGGALIHCISPIAAIGETMLIEIKYREEPIQFKGKIAKRDQVELELVEEEPEKSVIRWTDGATGAFGIQFIEMSPERQMFLHRLVSYFAEKYGWDDEP